MKSNHSINGLKRWSCKPKHLPDVSAIKNLHIYDFDNTLFSSPLPNPQLWHPSTIGSLQAYEIFAHGGWWHNPDILASTGEGIENEEPRAWKGWWNETVVQLAEISIQEEDSLSVLLTGRGESNFADIINRIAKSRALDFDMVVLKPEVGPNQQQFSSTMEFKQAFLRDLMLTYRSAQTIRIYEDRVKHVKGFRDYLEKFNKSYMAYAPDSNSVERISPCTAEVIHVCELKSSLEPQAEIMAVQSAINRHNTAIKTGGVNPTRAAHKYYRINEQFQYFGYLINQSDSARLITLCNAHAHLIDSGEVKYLASSILIAPYYPRKDLLEKVGGRGNKVTWQVNGVARFEDRIWAARVTPISEKPVHTQDDVPMVILAIRKGSRQIDANRIKNWLPPSVEKQFIFETVVDHKVTLKIEEADESAVDQGDERRTHRNGAFNKRKFHHDDGGQDGSSHNNTPRNDGSWAQVVAGNKNQTSNPNPNPNPNPKPNQNQNQNHQPGNGNRFSRGGKGNFGNKRGHNQFNNNNNPSVNPNSIPTQPQNQGNGPRQGRGNGRRNGRGAAGAGGYKSLDDYSGGYDGASDSQGGGRNTNNAANGAMVMDY